MLDNKGFWDDLSQSGIDPALIPGYRAEHKTTTDPPKGRNLDIESVLADIRKKAEEIARTPARVPTMWPEDEAFANERTGDTPVSDDPPASETPAAELDNREIMQEMLSTVRELTEEVKQLRAQIEARPYDVANDPSEEPPGVAADTEDSSVPETTPDTQSEPKKPVKKNKALSIITTVLFYAVIAAMVLGAFLMRSTSKGEPFMIAGFSAANVLTSSMSDVYPQGSLIITKEVDAKELQIGDDITFMVSEDSSITHRIIGITENYQGTGVRAFQTQGTKNPNPDKEMVAAANVVGKVIFHSKALGDFANFVKENWPILIFVLIVIIALITFLKWNAKKSNEDDEEPKDEPKEKKTRSHTKERNKHSKRRNKRNGNE